MRCYVLYGFLDRYDKECGCWIDAGGHLVYTLREMLGDAAEVPGMRSRLSRSEMEGEDHAAVVIRYESGVLAQIYVSYGHNLLGSDKDWPQGYMQSLEVHGDKGAVRYAVARRPELAFFFRISPKLCSRTGKAG